MFQSEHIVKMFQPEHYAQCSSRNIGEILGWLTVVKIA